MGRKISILLVCVLMSGCKMVEGMFPEVELANKPPPSLATFCGPLPELTDPNMQGMVQNHIEVAKQYHLCKQKHKSLVEWINVDIDSRSKKK